MKISRPFHLVILLFAAILVVPVSAWAERSQGKSDHHSDQLAGLVIFGDSLSDTGNKYH